jgi:hypothetical protein
VRSIAALQSEYCCVAKSPVVWILRIPDSSKMTRILQSPCFVFGFHSPCFLFGMPCQTCWELQMRHGCSTSTDTSNSLCPAFSSVLCFRRRRKIDNAKSLQQAPVVCILVSMYNKVYLQGKLRILTNPLAVLLLCRY